MYGLVVAPAMAAATTVRTSTAIIPSAAAAAIVPSTAIQAAAPIHPIPSTRPTVILVAEQPIAPIASGNLVVNRLRREAALAEVLSMPFNFARKVRQLSRTIALAHALRHNRRAVF